MATLDLHSLTHDGAGLKFRSNILSIFEQCEKFKVLVGYDKKTLEDILAKEELMNTGYIYDVTFGDRAEHEFGDDKKDRVYLYADGDTLELCTTADSISSVLNTGELAYLLGICKIKHIDLSGITQLIGSVASVDFCENRCVETLNLGGLEIGRGDKLVYGCESLRDISFGDTSCVYVNSLDLAFAYCGKLEIIDLSELDMSNLSSIAYGFKGCTGLREINFGNTYPSKYGTVRCKCVGIFDRCERLEEIKIKQRFLHQILRDNKETYKLKDNYLDIGLGNKIRII